MILRLLVPLVIAFGAVSVPELAHAQPVQVASGEDLGAWISLEQRRLEGAERTAAYRAFVLAWASSPLATAAWDRLVELSADQPWSEDPMELERIAQVQARWADQKLALRETQARRRVASISLVSTAR